MTAGPLALARELLIDEKDPEAPFFVLNSDITSEFPFAELLQYHKAHAKEGTTNPNSNSIPQTLTQTYPISNPGCTCPLLHIRRRTSLEP